MDGLIYLDNAATTFPKPECVYSAADEFYRCWGGNAGRGGNPLARKAEEQIAETRSSLAALLGVRSAERVIFTPSATVSLNLVILGAGLRAGDLVYATPFEHNSVLRPLQHLRQVAGITVQEVPFDHGTFACQLERLKELFRADPPALVCLTQASNVCGAMPPVAEVARMAKEANPEAIVVVDGAQVAGLWPLPLDEGLVDAYVFSGHKSLYGPYGVGGVVLASDWRPAPLLFGGTGTASESLDMPGDLPTAYEAGSHNIWSIAGLQGALGWLRDVRREEIVRHTIHVAEQLRAGLNSLPGVQVATPPCDEPWCGILSFTIDGVSPQAIEACLGAKHIAVRAGLHCASWAHQWLQTAAGGGTVRASPGFFNKPCDVLGFLETVRDLAYQT